MDNMYILNFISIRVFIMARVNYLVGIQVNLVELPFFSTPKVVLIHFQNVLRCPLHNTLYKKNTI